LIACEDDVGAHQRITIDEDLRDQCSTAGAVIVAAA
jgi:hypothetical protein